MIYPSAWGVGDTHEQQPCVATYTFADGRVIRRTTYTLVKRDQHGIRVSTTPLPTSYVEMEGFSDEERAEFIAMNNTGDSDGMEAFINRHR